jgi:hypothetical protein
VFPTCYPLGLDAIDALAVNDAAVATGELITRVAPTLGDGERATARQAFHATVAAVVQARVDPSPAVVMLAAACAGFPESAMFAGWYGDVLHQTGQHQAAVIELARAAELFQTARAVATDLPLAQDPPLTWTLARTVLHAGQGNG